MKFLVLQCQHGFNYLSFDANSLFQVFIPDYNVSLAEVVIPGADLSQHLRFVNIGVLNLI